MERTKKLGLWFVLALIALGTLFYIVRLIKTSQYRSRIPDLPATSLSAPLKEQLSIAQNTALHDPGSDNLGMLGMSLHSASFYEKAMQCYNLAIKKDNSKWIWRYYLGYIEKELGNSNAAIEDFTDVIKLNPKAYTAWYYLAKAYQNTGSEDKARETFNKIAFLPDNETVVRTLRINYMTVQSLAKFELARIYLSSNKPDDAEKLLLGIVRTNHSIGPVYRLLGNVYSAKGNANLSQKYLTRAQDLSNATSIADTLADKLALMSRSEIYLSKQIEDAVKSANPALALELLKHALKYLPDDKFIISKAIIFFLETNMGEYAIPYLDKHFIYFRDDPNEMSVVADILYRNGFYPQSLRYFARAIELKPENNELRASYALSFLKDNKRDSSLLIMNDLFEKNRKDIKVLANEAAFMIIAGDNNRAKAFLKIFRQLAPDNAKVPKLEAIISESDGNHLKAISLYEDSFKRDPDDSETATKLGILLIRNKLWEKAVKLFMIALEHHPNDPFLLEKSGTLLVSCPDPKLRNIDEGLELSERAFSHISSPSTTIISSARTLALGYAIKGNFQEANHYIRIAVRMAYEVKAPKDFIEGLMQLEDKIKVFGQKK